MFNSNFGLSASDVLALSNRNDGFGDGNGWIWLIVLIALFGGWGNGGFGGYGVGANNGYILSNDMSMLSRQLSDGFNSVDNALDRQNAGICDLGYTSLNLNNQTNTNIMQGFNAVQSQLADCCCRTQQNIKDVDYNIATTGAGITNAIKDCCCENEKIAMQNRYDSAQNHCATLTAIDKLGDRIIDYMSNDKLQALRDENASLKLCASQSAQNQYLINQLRPAPVPAFNVPSPFYYGGFGYGTTIA